MDFGIIRRWQKLTTIAKIKIRPKKHKKLWLDFGGAYYTGKEHLGGIVN
jgi:hypothetical protein